MKRCEFSVRVYKFESFRLCGNVNLVHVDRFAFGLFVLITLPMKIYGVRIRGFL